MAALGILLPLTGHGNQPANHEGSRRLSLWAACGRFCILLERSPPQCARRETFEVDLIRKSTHVTLQASAHRIVIFYVECRWARWIAVLSAAD
jgi:hypothetical protein